jgi:hypothetical protein
MNAVIKVIPSILSNFIEHVTGYFKRNGGADLLSRR